MFFEHRDTETRRNKKVTLCLRASVFKIKKQMVLNAIPPFLPVQTGGSCCGRPVRWRLSASYQSLI